jgi:regulator of RNase E activity RraA
MPGTLVIADEDGILVLDSELALDSLKSFEAEAEEDEIYRTKLLDGKLPSQLSPIDALIKGSVNDRS